MRSATNSSETDALEELTVVVEDMSAIHVDAYEDLPGGWRRH
ncbi:unnamed protein product [Cuscuta europaea]|uniref:Uncharacterized protein n=1 Tax=Cuscuta europaea TaxID=41803 RepID=A0A9P0YNQ0_CUSEU|nr:unnamed protein product [Cuscuta europaea]